ncbi:hypothetical protein D9M71_571150 [compost metagenome]
MAPQMREISARGSIPAPGMVLQHTGLQFFPLPGAQILIDRQGSHGKPRVEQLLPDLTAERAVRPGSAEPAQLADGPQPATELLGIAGIKKITGGVRVVITQQGPVMQVERDREHAP